MDVKTRFEQKVERITESGCWLWTGNYGRAGYGQFWLNGTKNAHRAAYEIYYGPIPEGMHVCHHCDCRGCVNPRHLFLGTHADNMADRNRKGRAAKGERHGKRKLTTLDVAIIRGSTTATKVLAERYGVHRTLIQQIRRGQGWR